MNLSFLPREIYAAVRNLNVNKLSEIRLREGQPVMAEYCGEYRYLGLGGVCTREGAVVCRDVAGTLNRAMGGCVYSHAEELKEGFVTVEGGVRIGIAGEYITENGRHIPASIAFAPWAAALTIAREVIFDLLNK